MEVHGCLFWHVAMRFMHNNRTCLCRTRPNLCSHLLHEAPCCWVCNTKAWWEFDQTLSPRESLACETSMCMFISQQPLNRHVHIIVSRRGTCFWGWLAMCNESVSQEEFKTRIYGCGHFSRWPCTSFASLTVVLSHSGLHRVVAASSVCVFTSIFALVS